MYRVWLRLMRSWPPIFFFTDPPTPDLYTLSLHDALPISEVLLDEAPRLGVVEIAGDRQDRVARRVVRGEERLHVLEPGRDRKSTRLNSSHRTISYAVFCLKKKNKRAYQKTKQFKCSSFRL